MDISPTAPLPESGQFPGFPRRIPDFSTQDDREDLALHAFLRDRVPGGVNGSLVLSRPNTVRGRVMTADGWASISRVRVIGRRFWFIDDGRAVESLPEIFDRQVGAFGPDTCLATGARQHGVPRSWQ